MNLHRAESEVKCRPG